jgi:hypothetical protein
LILEDAMSRHVFSAETTRRNMRLAFAGRASLCISIREQTAAASVGALANDPAAKAANRAKAVHGAGEWATAGSASRPVDAVESAEFTIRKELTNR